MQITIPGGTSASIKIPEKSVQPEQSIERVGFSIAETAESLGISVPTATALIKDGQIRSTRIGRRVIVSVQSLRDFIDRKPTIADKSDIACVAEGKERDEWQH